MSAAAEPLRPAPYLVAIPGAALLLVYAVVNGVPFAYPDAFVYVSYGDAAWERVGRLLGLGATEGTGAVAPAPAAAAAPAAPAAAVTGGGAWTPASGRSVFYGLLASLPGPLPHPWTGIAVQAYCAALAVALFWRAALGRVGPGYLAAMAALALLSTLGVFASLAMPDVWAGIGILAVAVLAAMRRRIARVDALVLWAFVLFAAVSHSSHLAVLAAFAGLCALGRLMGLAAVPWARVGAMAALAALAAGLDAASEAAVARAAGAPARGMPFLTAHLVDGGPGMAFIEERCPEAGFAVCEAAADLPVDWRRFLFRIAARSEAFDARVTAEDAGFALAVLRHDPSGVLGLALRDAARQVVMIGLVSTPIRAAIGERGAAETTIHPFGAAVLGGRLYDHGWLFRAVSAANAALVVAALAGLAVAAARRAPPLDGEGDLRAVLAAVLLGILLNAAVCGILASPYDRFQARVAWLVPLMGLAALAARLGNHSGSRPLTFP